MGLGTLLVDRGVLTPEQLDELLDEQRDTGERFDHLIVRHGYATRADVLRAVGDQFHIPVVDLTTTHVEPEVLDRLPPKLVFKQNCVPVREENGTLTVATSDPFQISAMDELRLLVGCAIEIVLADEEDLHRFIRANYGVGGDTLEAMADTVEIKPGAHDAATSDEVEQAQEASVIKLVNDLLAEAITERATDIHIEPYERSLDVRYRIDGVLQKANVPPTIHQFGAAIISRLKIMASLDIAEKRKPQDGRISYRAKGAGGRAEEFDLRVSVIPMLFGEGIVLRVLSKTAVLMSLDDLGFPGHIMGRWDTLITRPHGIVLVTGPTGSGKSTTLYASLNRIVSEAIKVITVEDPVEYHVEGVNQIQVNSKVGLTFANGLRSILRHDPDVVMIGEIRDRETAETAVQASLTGHLVFSTLHTNDASGATTRLLDMGVEPFLVASSLEGVLAQRLVRRICPDCGHDVEPDPAELPGDFQIPDSGVLRQGAGCKTCRQTGFRGRVGLYELLTLSEPIREMIMQRTSAPVIAERAVADGDLVLLRRAGFDKVREGVTTIAEVLRAVNA